MSFRRTIALLASVFVVLLAALVLGYVFTPQGASRRQSEALLFPGFKAKEVRKVEISDAASRVSILLSDRWMIDAAGETFPASGDKVEGLLREVAALSRGSVVTRDAKTAESLGLSPREAKRLALSGQGGGPLAVLSIGRYAAAGGGYYIRVGDAPEVLQTGAGLASYLGTARSEWANLRILPSDVRAESVMRLTVSGGIPLPDAKGTKRVEYTLVKGSDAQGALSWRFEGAGAAKVQAQKADAMAAAVAGLEGSDYLSGVEAAASVTALVTVSLTDNRTFTIRFSAKNASGQYPCSLADGRYAFLVPEQRVGEILVPLDALTDAAR